MDRRLFLGGLAAAAAAPLFPAFAALPVPASKQLLFDVLRNGKRVGAHRLRFEPTADGLKVLVDVTMKIGFGPITLFNYQHNATELWRGDEWQSVEALTVQNGKRMVVKASRNNTGVAVEGPKGKFTAPVDTMAATHWNRRMLDGPFLNTQTGEVQKPKIARMGEAVIPARGGTIRAERFAMTGEVELDTFYDAGPTWAGLKFKGPDGSAFTYQRA